MIRRARLFTPGGAAVIASGLLLCGGAALTAQEPPHEQLVSWQEIESVLRPDGPAAVRASTAALLLSGQVGGSLPLAMLTQREPGIGPTSRLVVQLELDGRPLLADDARRVADLDLFVYVLDTSDRIVASNANRFSVDLATWRQQLAEGGLMMLASVELPPGEYRLRVLVRDRELEALGVAAVTVAIPEADRDSPTGWLPERRDGWLIAVVGDGDSLLTRPLRLDQTSYVPAALPVWSPAASALAILSTPAGQKPDSIDARLQTADGTASAALTVSSLRSTNSAGGRDNHLIELRLPDLPHGPYDLVLSLAGDEVIRRPVFVWHQPEGRAVTWNDLPAEIEMASGESQLPTEPISGRSTPRSRVDLAALANGYRSTLDTLTSGDVEGAAVALRTLETSADQAGHEALMWLEKAQWSAAQRLVSRSPDQLLSMFLLHLGQIEHYRERQQSQLGEHSVRITGRAARELRQRARDRQSIETAAMATALLGETLRQSDRMRGSEVLFRQAVALDPTVTIALVGLAFAAEQTGRYDEAVTTLEQLVDADPDNPEARLRLAVNLRRIARPDDATPLLRSLIDSDAPDWIRLVAVHEQARIAADAGDDRAALAELRAAAARWPDDQNVAVFIAYLLDRRQAPRQARQTIEHLTAAGRPSSRQRYMQSPPAKLEEIRTLLLERAGIDNAAPRPAAEGVPR